MDNMFISPALFLKTLCESLEGFSIGRWAWEGEGLPGGLIMPSRSSFKEWSLFSGW